MPQTRKLAAIMFTDIKDFTKRMNASESLGLRLMQTHNEVMDGAIQRHQGVLVKNIGDAYLVDFGSAVNAVEAAVDAQGLFAGINKDAGVDEEILVRISIHLGDVVVRDRTSSATGSMSPHGSSRSRRPVESVSRVTFTRT
jgi:adenylate cyclase